jgi:uncharacterized membrane protein YozB (DUF420 family)
VDPNLVFWSAALANLGVVVFCTSTGVKRIRAKDVAGHRRMMFTAISLVIFFLVSYLVKVGMLGREDKSAWTTFDFVILYLHELCVTSMLIGGAIAIYRAAKFRAGLGPNLKLPPDTNPLQGLQRHRRAGWVAVVGSVLGFVTAIGVLAGMFARV